ncbi:MAG: phage tail protein [Coriobacteriia bacterium]|nr:phage tail protein [Coriobacteriia bacterium]
MSPNDVTNVSVGRPKAGGAVFVAPTTAALPTDAVAPLGEGFENVGYCSEDGLTNSVSTESSSIKAWGGEEVLNIQTSRSETFAFAMIETNEAALKQVYGVDNVSGSGSNLSILHNSKLKSNHIWVFEILLAEDRVKRIVVPCGKITSVDDIVYKDGDPIKYGVTLSALPDQAGNTAYEYIAEILGE